MPRENHVWICELPCNHPAWPMTRPGPRQCTNNLLLENPIHCKNEAASVPEEILQNHQDSHKSESPSWEQSDVLRQKPNTGGKSPLSVETVPESKDFFSNCTCVEIITTTTTCPSCVYNAKRHRGEFSLFILLESEVGPCLPFEAFTTMVTMPSGMWFQPHRPKPMCELRADSTPYVYVYSTGQSLIAYFEMVQSQSLPFLQAYTKSSFTTKLGLWKAGITLIFFQTQAVRKMIW